MINTYVLSIAFSYFLLFFILKMIILCEYYNTKIIASNLNIRCFKILSSEKSRTNSSRPLRSSGQLKSRRDGLNLSDSQSSELKTMSPRNHLPNDDVLLLQTEKVFLDTDRALEDLMRVYSGPNLILSIIFFSNIIFAAYIGTVRMFTKSYNAENEAIFDGALLYILVVVDTLLMILLLHDPADKFQDTVSNSNY